MSIQGNEAVEGATKEIREFIKTLESHVTDTEAFWVLSEIDRFVFKIQEAAEKGWY